MHFKLIIAFVDCNKTDKILVAAREKGATGSTVISQARGEGSHDQKTFLGLHVESPRDVLLMLVEENNAREILETINKVGAFDKKSHEGIAFQIDVEDAVGVMHQVDILNRTLKEEL
ncbi:MAG TPA: P-II family nitrogen regulator [Candidatus Thioglobus sp.]|jgi:nitrogen regulatory protein PII|nr:P-II family nitrogen regulator [Candidatus Thioglobus sp.]HIL20102.1 P-II family nitrogen regulator [Candidatus Thioglobus sp.]